MQTWKISSSSWRVWLREVDEDVEEEGRVPFHGSCSVDGGHDDGGVE
jgi:hypothetical protein